MSELAIYQGGCACGAVRYEARGPAENLCFCHCASCRRAAGASPVTWGTFASERFAITRGALVLHNSSPPVTRGFCAACGTSLTYAPAVLRPECHIWVSDRVDWAPLSDGLPQFAGWRSGD